MVIILIKNDLSIVSLVPHKMSLKRGIDFLGNVFEKVGAVAWMGFLLL